MATPTRNATARRAGRLAVAVLALACAAAPAPGATSRAGPPPSDDDDDSGMCLRVGQSIAEGAAPLRLAAPPLDVQHGPSTARALFSRMLGSGAPARPIPNEAASSTPGFAALFSSPGPTAQRLVDGSADLLSGRHATAERAFSECAQLAVAQPDALAEAACANNLAVVYAATGRHAQARTAFERALRLYETPRTPPADPALPPGLAALINPMAAGLAGLLGERMPPEQRGRAGAGTGSPELDRSLKEAALAAWQQFDGMNTRRGSELVNLNLGNLALATGRLADAQAHLERAFKSHAANEDPACRAAAAADLARLYRRLDRGHESRALLARHRPRPRDPGDPEGDFSLVHLGTISLAPATAAVAGAEPAPTLPPAAAGPRKPGNDVAWSLGEPAGRLGGDALGQLLAEAMRPTAGQQAAASWQRLALRAAAGRRPDLGFSAHAELMRLHRAQGRAGEAIFHGKNAANLAQASRADLADASPSRDARRAFLRERRRVYVALAQLLLDQQRLPEAEAVLQLLKEDEGQQFIDGQRPPLGSLPLTAAEQTRQRQDDAAAQQLRQADAARLAAVTPLPIGGNVLLLLGPAQIEAQRLRLALDLPALPAQLRRQPWRPAGDFEIPKSMVREVLAFFTGPQPRVERALAELIEDLPAFDPPVGAADRARLADILKRLPQIQAELAPLLNDAAPTDGPAVTVTVRPAGHTRSKDDGPEVVNYISADALTRLWRSLRESDEIEARALRRAAEPDALAAGAAAAPAGPADTPALLARQPVPTALLYYLPGDERLDVLLVSATGHRHVRLALPRQELDRSVAAFIDQLRRSERDPRPAARAMYERLFGPVAQAVADTGAQVLALSLADKLRYLPFAALHDGEGWLVERYALAVHAGGPLAGRLKPASAAWRAAAFGASLGGGEFAPLLNVHGEIAAVVRRDGAAGGVLAGDAWLDRAFTAQRLRSALAGGAKVMHIASHFKFVGGDAAASYLLLGDGGKLSLRELAGPDYRFDRTELVTLSACTTGLSADDTYGQEVDGLAALLMGQGAPSVLASLWEVNDRSTATLMASLYRLRESRQLSRAKALQQAQLAMIRAAAGATGGAAPQQRGVSRVRLPGDPEPDPADSAFAPPASLGTGHPHHWAPFVLMGNWL